MYTRGSLAPLGYWEGGVIESIDTATQAGCLKRSTKINNEPIEVRVLGTIITRDFLGEVRVGSRLAFKLT